MSALAIESINPPLFMFLSPLKRRIAIVLLKTLSIPLIPQILIILFFADKLLIDFVPLSILVVAIELGWGI